MVFGKLQVYTGNGKGKTTSALGLVIRALSYNKKVYFIQFLKNKKTGEVIDPTKDQFDYPLDYSKSRNRFFLTNKPSKRTLILLNRIYEKNNN